MKRTLLLGISMACVTLAVTAGTAEAQFRVNPGGSFSGPGSGPGISVNVPGVGNVGWGNPGYNQFQSGYGYPGSGYGYPGTGWGQNQYWNRQPYLPYSTVQPGYGYFNSAPVYGQTFYPGSTGTYGNIGTFAASPGADQYQSFYEPVQQANTNAAMMRVLVPQPTARVWFDGQETRQQGTQRTFSSPPLEPGSNYSYTIRASWEENGQPVTREKTVQVAAGREVTVNFMESTSGDRTPLSQPGAQPLNPPSSTPGAQPGATPRTQPGPRPADQPGVAPRTQPDARPVDPASPSPTSRPGAGTNDPPRPNATPTPGTDPNRPRNQDGKTPSTTPPID